MVAPALLDSGLIVGGIVLLVAGAWAVVEAGSSLARRWGISPMWVGLTVVALGTSLPELVVSTIASLQGSGDLAVANVVGSNILNVFIVLGATAAIVAVPAGGVTVRRNLLLITVTSLAVWLLAADGVIHRAEGLLLVALAPWYVLHMYREEKRGWIALPEGPVGFERFPPWLQWSTMGLGLAVLVAGGVSLVEGAQGIAARAGVPARIIGLTIVAMGTSLPELATSLVAAFRRKPDLALGNLIGSNMLNLLVVLGTAGAVRSLPVASSLWRVDMPVMILSALLLLRFSSTQNKVSRVEGMLMLLAYVAYLWYLWAVGVA